MSSFRDLSRDERLGTHGLAGRPAEDAFRRFMTGKGYVENVHYTNIGWDRANMDAALVATLAEFEQHRPDFVQVGGHYWEVKGAGRRGVVCLKHEDLVVLWRDYACRIGAGRQVRFFIYNQPADAALQMPLESVLAAVRDPRTQPTLLDGNKRAYDVPLQVFLDHLVADAFALLKEQRKLAVKKAQAAEAASVQATIELAGLAGVSLAELPAVAA